MVVLTTKQAASASVDSPLKPVTKRLSSTEAAQRATLVGGVRCIMRLHELLLGSHNLCDYLLVN